MALMIGVQNGDEIHIGADTVRVVAGDQPVQVAIQRPDGELVSINTHTRTMVLPDVLMRASRLGRRLRLAIDAPPHLLVLRASLRRAK